MIPILQMRNLRIRVSTLPQIIHEWEERELKYKYSLTHLYPSNYLIFLPAIHLMFWASITSTPQMAAALCLWLLCWVFCFSRCSSKMKKFCHKPFWLLVSPPPIPTQFTSIISGGTEHWAHHMESPRTVTVRMSLEVWLHASTPGAQQARYCVADPLRCVVIIERKENYLPYKPKYLYYL